MLHGLKNMKHKFVTHLKAFRKFVCQNEQHLTTCNRDIATIKENWCVPRTHQLVTNLYLIINKNFCMMKKHLFWKNAVLALSMMLLSVGAFAQQHEVKGTVLDESQLPIPGANVVIKGTTVGTITTGNGEFTMNAADGDVLQVSYIGYNTEEITVSGNGPYNISLVPDVVGLDEVVVVGYGTQKKSDLTGSVASVRSDDLKKLSITDAASALQGKASGVQILNYSGAPGQGAAIRVRGYSSNSGNIGPLLIVDGLKVDNIQYLDPSMIESMEILKDAASAAIYGAEAGNGVVLITTKSGQDKGDGTITYSYKLTQNQLAKKPDVMNRDQYIDFLKQKGVAIEAAMEKNGDDGTIDTDWADALFEKSYTQQHSLSMQGGNQRGHYFVSLNSLDNNGIVIGDRDVYKRLSAQINADYKIKDWLTVGTNTSIEKWSTKSVSQMSETNSVLMAVIQNDPLTPVYYDELTDYADVTAKKYAKNPELAVRDDDGRLLAVSKYVENDHGSPLIQLYRTNAENGGVTVRGTAFANLSPIKGFVYTSRLGYRISYQNRHSYSTPYYANSMAKTDNYNLEAEARTGLYYQWENFFNYNIDFGKNNIGVMAGMSYIEDKNDNVRGTANGKDILSNYEENFRYLDYVANNTLTEEVVEPIANNKIEQVVIDGKTYNTKKVKDENGNKVNKTDEDGNTVLVNGQEEIVVGRVRYSTTKTTSLVTKTFSNKPSRSASLSYFGRLTYSYDNKYSLQFNFRADAFDESKLPKENRWGKFPSVSAGWTLSNESFIKDNISTDLMSFLKIRASWGRNGNINVLRDYPYTTTIAYNQKWYQYSIADNEAPQVYGSMPSRVANPDLKWETSEQIDLGLDARFLNNRLTVGIDWYKKTTKDLLVDVAPQSGVGVSSITKNAGEIMNKGLEIELGWKEKIGDLNYSVNGNISTLKNEVTYLDPNVGGRILHGSYYVNQIRNAFEEGHPIWYFYGWKFDKVNPEDGSYSLVDLNEDGQITDADRTNIGQGMPKYTYGLTINLEYKGFDFTVFGNGVGGNSIFPVLFRTDRPENNTLEYYHKNAWTEDNKSGSIPSLGKCSTDTKYWASDANIFKGDYFKFKQIQLGYTLPADLTKKVAVQNARVFVSLDDFFTITKYPGMDPETATTTNADQMGIDLGSYPVSKKFIFGVSLTF